MANSVQNKTIRRLPTLSAIMLRVGLLLTGLVVFLPSFSLSGSLTHLEGIILRSATAVLLAAVFFYLNRKSAYRDWARIVAMFLIADLGLLVSWLTATPLQSLLAADLTTAKGIALAKFSETLPVVVTIFICLHFLKIQPADLQIRRGRLMLGLAVGGGFFILFSLLAALSFSETATVELLLGGAPWLLIFVFANAFGEELLFRGMFLSFYEKAIGSKSALVMTALIFASIHFGVTYTPDMLGFVALTFILGLVWGYLIRKTGSIWGSVVFHAGADVMIFVPIVIEYSTRTSP